VKFRWPPSPLGLGPQLNLAVLAAPTRAQLVRRLWLAPVVGLATALAMVAGDEMLFGGQTWRASPGLDAHPPVGLRVLVALFGSLVEEVVFRLGIATGVGWLAYATLKRMLTNPTGLAQWTGALAAAVAVGMMHVAQVDDPSRFWRIMTINVVGHLVYGRLYWRVGFELAWLTHASVTAILYIGLPALRWLL